MSIRAIVMIAMLVCSMAAGVVGLSIWLDKSHSIANALRTDQNSALFLAGQVEHVVRAIDNTLIDLREGLINRDRNHEQQRDPEHPIVATKHLTALRDRIPGANQLSITDRTGRVMQTTSSSVPPNGLGDRDYFRELRTADDDQLNISTSVLSRFNNEMVIVFARRVTGPDGSFLGIILLSLSASFLEHTYHEAGLLNNQTFALMRQDGTIAFRYPVGERWIGQRVPDNEEWHTSVAKGGGSFFAPGLFDGFARWVSVRPVVAYPLVVTITTPKDSILADWQSRSIYTASGAAGFLVCLLGLLVILDREFKKVSASRRQLARTNAHFAAALGNMIQGLCMFDRDGLLQVCNGRFRAIYGLPPSAEVIGSNREAIVALLSSGLTDPAMMSELRPGQVAASADNPSRRVLVELTDGRVVAVTSKPMVEGGWLETHEDVTERRRHQEKVELLARCDPLTGIANRSCFLDRLQTEISSIGVDGRSVVVFIVDLDRFKDVNDSLGHDAGDLLLKEVTRRLKSSIRAEDTVARLGGDEFAIIQSPPRSGFHPPLSMDDVREHAMVLANRILGLIGEPYEISDQSQVIKASMGVALSTRSTDDPTDLMRKADLALYRAKAQGRDTCCFFDPAMITEVEARHRLERDLRRALERKEFFLHYQPIVEIASGAVCEYEALVRWNHPERGLVSPDQFIPIAEQTGLITQLGEWILQTACLTAADWPASVKLAVNISAVQFYRTNLLDVIMRALVESGLPPDRLEVEITETVLLKNEEQTLLTLHALKSIGVSVSLDDFGTGYSSLSYLTTFPFDKIKIDRSFTRDLLTRSESAAIVCSAAALGRDLRMVVLAEGVETREQVNALRMVGVTQAQGYLFGRPGPADSISADADGRLAELKRRQCA